MRLYTRETGGDGGCPHAELINEMFKDVRGSLWRTDERFNEFCGYVEADLADSFTRISSLEKRIAEQDRRIVKLERMISTLYVAAFAVPTIWVLTHVITAWFAK